MAWFPVNMINYDNNYYIPRVSCQTKNKKITQCVIYFGLYNKLMRWSLLQIRKLRKKLLVQGIKAKKRI